ncbi:MAG: dihydrofolate reductase family protein [Verrucomicrobia bacterium]|nr:dihydrofolate reductase family protein [Verrucomicrobiota bacterium]
MPTLSTLELSSTRSDRPRVLVDFAITADGKASTAALTPARFTSQRDKHRLLEIRALADAVMAGRGTVELDRMTMTLPDESLRETRRALGKQPEPLRVVLSHRGRLPADLPLLNRSGAKVLVYSTEQMPSSAIEELRGKATVYRQPGETVDLRVVFHDLVATYQVASVVVEGGPSLVNELARLDFIDEIYLTLAPVLFGGRAAPSLTGIPGEFLPETRRFDLAGFEIEEGECYLHFKRLHAPN